MYVRKDLWSVSDATDNKVEEQMVTFASHSTSWPQFPFYLGFIPGKNEIHEQQRETVKSVMSSKGSYAMCNR